MTFVVYTVDIWILYTWVVYLWPALAIKYDYLLYFEAKSDDYLSIRYVRISLILSFPLSLSLSFFIMIHDACVFSLFRCRSRRRFFVALINVPERTHWWWSWWDAYAIAETVWKNSFTSFSVQLLQLISIERTDSLNHCLSVHSIYPSCAKGWVTV